MRIRHGVRLILRLAVLAAATLAATQGAAQSYPTRPIRVIMPFPPGGGADFVIRATGQELTKRLGQPFILESRPGASGIIAGEACSKAVPDGHTLCFLSQNMTSFNPILFQKLPYTADRDFEPIVLLVYLTTGIIVPASSTFNSVAELRALAKAKPGYLNFGSVGNGSEPHQFLEWLKQLWEVNIVHVAYKGAAPIAPALLAGEIQLTRAGIATFLGQIKAGKLKVLAVSGKERSPLLPDVPTFAEVGLDGYAIQPWFGLVAPAGTPKSIVTKLNAEIVRIYGDPRFTEREIIKQGNVPATGTSEAFAAFLKQDRERAEQMLRITKVRPD